MYESYVISYDAIIVHAIQIQSISRRVPTHNYINIVELRYDELVACTSKKSLLRGLRYRGNISFFNHSPRKREKCHYSVDFSMVRIVIARFDYTFTDVHLLVWFFAKGFVSSLVELKFEESKWFHVPC